LWPADGHEQGGADVLVAEVGEPGVAQLMEGLAAGVALEQLPGHQDLPADGHGLGTVVMR
jgi:hypothetical protein